MAHATLHQPEYFVYLDKADRAAKTFALMKAPICFVGHTHQGAGNLHVSSLAQPEPDDGPGRLRQ